MAIIRGENTPSLLRLPFDLFFADSETSLVEIHKLRNRPDAPTKQTSLGWTTFVYHKNGSVDYAVVSVAGACRKNKANRDEMLVHEAVHIWQKACSYLDISHEDELEAYSIQNIFGTLRALANKFPTPEER